MAGIAREIAATRPELVGLQEIETVEVAPMVGQGVPGTFIVTYDYLELLTNALATRGAHYTAVASSEEFDVTMPMLDLQTGNIVFARLVDHEVILARTDLPPGHLRVSNPQSGHYTSIVQIPSIGFSQTRGWCSVDVSTRGETFRYICTHLEEELAPTIQLAQAQELLGGPANVALPVVIVGDFNADPLHRNGTVTYDQFGQAGFKDAWSVAHPRKAAGGLTWGHDAALADPGVKFVWRLDFVFYRDQALKPTGASVMDLRLNRSQSPLWPSDHAALVTQFRIGSNKASQR
jgi:endonuclease/exonuclease/phosphatase family metal-dependent hydrolase